MTKGVVRDSTAEQEAVMLCVCDFYVELEKTPPPPRSWQFGSHLDSPESQILSTDTFILQPQGLLLLM